MAIWRVGRKLGRTLYKNDVCIGMVDTSELAAEIVETMNSHSESEQSSDEPLPFDEEDRALAGMKPEVPPVDRSARTTLHGMDPDGPEHRELLPSGMQKDYVVLTAEERSKGFVRPVRSAYKHVGVRPKGPLRDLTPEEQERYKQYNYSKFELYLEGSESKKRSGAIGRFWTAAQLSSGCNTVTSMGRALSETYARDPLFYSGTYCCGCNAHFPVGAEGEFIWVDDGTRVGT